MSVPHYGGKSLQSAVAVARSRHQRNLADHQGMASGGMEEQRFFPY